MKWRSGDTLKRISHQVSSHFSSSPRISSSSSALNTSQIPSCITSFLRTCMQACIRFSHMISILPRISRVDSRITSWRRRSPRRFSCNNKKRISCGIPALKIWFLWSAVCTNIMNSARSGMSTGSLWIRRKPGRLQSHSWSSSYSSPRKLITRTYARTSSLTLVSFLQIYTSLIPHIYTAMSIRQSIPSFRIKIFISKRSQSKEFD